MRAVVLGVIVVLTACGSAAPAEGCRTNGDCPTDRVCRAGTCALAPDSDAGEPGSDGGTDGGTAIEVDASGGEVDAGPLRGESCADPIFLPLMLGPDAIGRAEWSGELGAYDDDGYTVCNDHVHTPDVVFEIELPDGPADIVAYTTPSDLDVVLGADQGCGSDTMLSGICSDDRAADLGDRSGAIFVWNYDPSRLAHAYVIIDGGDGFTSGVVTLHVEARPHASGTCGDGLDITGGGSIFGYGVDMSMNMGDCSVAAPDGDLVFSIHGGMPGAAFFADSNDFEVGLRTTGLACSMSADCSAVGRSSELHAMFPFENVVLEGVRGNRAATFELFYDP